MAEITKTAGGGYSYSGGVATPGRSPRFSFGATDLEDAPYASTEITITQAQLVALRATPITVVGAPGATKVIHFLGAYLELVYAGTGNNTESTANLGFKYTDGSGVQVNETVECTGFIDQTVSTNTHARPKLDPIVAATAATNQALVLHNLGGGEFGTTGGTPTSVLKVKVIYAVHAAS